MIIVFNKRVTTKFNFTKAGNGTKGGEFLYSSYSFQKTESH